MIEPYCPRVRALQDINEIYEREQPEDTSFYGMVLPIYTIGSRLHTILIVQQV